jgi:hypothetical protein
MDLDLVLLKYHVQSHEKLWFSTDVLPLGKHDNATCESLSPSNSGIPTLW